MTTPLVPVSHSNVPSDVMVTAASSRFSLTRNSCSARLRSSASQARAATSSSSATSALDQCRGAIALTYSTARNRPSRINGTATNDAIDSAAQFPGLFARSAATSSPTTVSPWRRRAILPAPKCRTGTLPTMGSTPSA